MKRRGVVRHLRSLLIQPQRIKPQGPYNATSPPKGAGGNSSRSLRYGSADGSGLQSTAAQDATATIAAVAKAWVPKAWTSVTYSGSAANGNSARARTCGSAGADGDHHLHPAPSISPAGFAARAARRRRRPCRALRPAAGDVHAEHHPRECGLGPAARNLDHGPWGFLKGATANSAGRCVPRAWAASPTRSVLGTVSKVPVGQPYRLTATSTTRT